MFLTIGLAIALTAVLATTMRRRGQLDSGNLGWMSEGWLNEHRASGRSPLW